MDRKLSYGLAVLIPVFIVIGILLVFSGHKQPSEPQFDQTWSACNTDSDCVEVYGHPCGDYACGGLTVTKAYMAQYQSYLNKLTDYFDQQGKSCPAPPCIDQQTEPKCIQSKCVMVPKTETPGEPVQPATVPFGERLAQEANALWGAGSVVYPATKEVAQEGWLRTSFRIEGTAKYDNICAIFMHGDKTRTTDNRTYFLSRNPVTVDNRSVCEIGVSGGVVDECGGLVISMDVEAMMTGYNRAADNWQEFMTCQSGTGSAFCRNECSLLLDGLMMEKREPIEITPITG